MWSRRGDLNP